MSRALAAFARAVLLGRCPHCGQAPMFEGWYGIRDRCGVCGTRFETAPGGWLGALAVGYGIGAVFALVAIAIEITWGPVGALRVDPWWTIAIASLVVTGLAYRPAKGAWYALLYLYGFMGVEGERPRTGSSAAPRDDSRPG